MVTTLTVYTVSTWGDITLAWPGGMREGGKSYELFQGYLLQAVRASRTRCTSHRRRSQSKRARHSVLSTYVNSMAVLVLGIRRTLTQYNTVHMWCYARTLSHTYLKRPTKPAASVVQDDVDSGYRFWKPPENKL